MRCANCGWDNAANLSRCEKCNAFLSGSMVAGGNISGNQQQNDDSKPLARTVAGAVSGNAYVDGIASVQPNSFVRRDDDIGQSCKKCGYPLIVGSNICPNCGEHLLTQCDDNVNINSKNRHHPESNFKDTVNPYSKSGHGIGGLSLKPIARQTENPDKFPLITIDGDKLLNRELLEVNNNTITSKVQAKLINKDGHWYIVDMSEQMTTFVRAKREFELSNGDVILMGDRKFEVIL